MHSATLPSPASRDPRGRFMPGMSGNPAGKKPGTRNNASQWRELMRYREETDIRGTVIDRAAAGNLPAAMFLCRQIDGPPRRGLIDLGIPLDTDPTRLAATINAHLIAGLLSPGEARDWLDVAQRSLALVASHQAADPDAIPFDAARREAAARLQAALDAEEAAERAAAETEHRRRAEETADEVDGTVETDEGVTAEPAAATVPAGDDTGPDEPGPIFSTRPADPSLACIPPASAGPAAWPRPVPAASRTGESGDPAAGPERRPAGPGACISPAFPGRPGLAQPGRPLAWDRP